MPVIPPITFVGIRARIPMIGLLIIEVLTAFVKWRALMNSLLGYRGDARGESYRWGGKWLE